MKCNRTQVYPMVMHKMVLYICFQYMQLKNLHLVINSFVAILIKN